MRCGVSGCRAKTTIGFHACFGLVFELCLEHLSQWRVSPELGRARSQLADFVRRVEAEKSNAVRRGKDASAGD